MIRFEENVLSVDVGGNLSVCSLDNGNTIKRCLTPKRSGRKRKGSLNYNMQQAAAVAKRMEKEVHSLDASILTRRIKQELIADELLCRQRMFQFVCRLYRLTDEALVLLQRRLLLQEKNFRNRSVPSYLPY